jgi:septum formation protein
VKLPPLILASGSPRRAELLRQLGRSFTVVVSDVPEVHSGHLTARELCQINAHRKARAVAKKSPDAIVIGADTLVYLGTRLFGKPSGLEEASDMLHTLQGQTHQVVTGVCLIHLREHRERVFAETTDVRFRALGEAEVRRYLQLVDPMDKAGAYAIQEHGELIIEEIDGSLSNVVGLPVERLQAELERFTAAPS